MNFKIMNKTKKALLLAFTILIVFSCVDEDKAPIVTFDSAGHGAYPRLLSETGDKLVNILTNADFQASQYGYTIEFVDENGGKDVERYVLMLNYIDVNGSNSVSAIEFKSYTAADFSVNADGFMELANVNLAAPEVAASVGITFADLSPGDKFNISGEIHMTNGDVFTTVNSSAAVEGPAFRGHFAFTLPAACPSDLTGNFNFSTVVGAGHPGCSGGEVVTGTVDIVAQGGGVYKFSDWAFGAYIVCYGGGGAGGDLTFTDVCGEVSFTGFTDSFGDTWTFVSSISGENWTIDWVNTYAEEAVSVITFPGGVPFTLK